MNEDNIIFIDQETNEIVDNKRNKPKGRLPLIITGSLLFAIVMYKFIAYVIADEIVEHRYDDDAYISLKTLLIVYTIIFSIVAYMLAKLTSGSARYGDECTLQSGINKYKAMMIGYVGILILGGVWIGSIVYTMALSGDGWWTYGAEYMKNGKSIYTDYAFITIIEIAMLYSIVITRLKSSKERLDIYTDACCAIANGVKAPSPTEEDMLCYTSQDGEFEVCLLKEEK